MSNSYQAHKSQVEAARQGDGKFGSYEAGESKATLAEAPMSEGDRIAEWISGQLDGVPAEVVDQDTIAIGEERDDGLSPMSVLKVDDGHWEFIAPDPDGEQSNITDATGDAYGSGNHIATAAADFYRDNVSGESAISEAQLPEAQGFDWNDVGERHRRIAAELNEAYSVNDNTTVESYNSGGGVINHEVRVTGAWNDTYSAIVADLDGDKFLVGSSATISGVDHPDEDLQEVYEAELDMSVSQALRDAEEKLANGDKR